MSMLIEGPKQPGNDINLYLGLLKEELDTLWKTPANTWDAAEKEYFLACLPRQVESHPDTR